MTSKDKEDVTRAVIGAIQARPGLSMDDLILACTPYTWNQVFLAIDELTRKGMISLKHRDGFYMNSPASVTKADMTAKNRQYIAEQPSQSSHLQG